ncbi:hypothetical protein ACMBCN_01790, partial [Candidatus Liberibacter asiaticus]|nr:hypothetical protein [Candidatus Liberibacter asiaticus]
KMFRSFWSFFTSKEVRETILRIQEAIEDQETSFWLRKYYPSQLWYLNLNRALVVVRFIIFFFFSL